MEAPLSEAGDVPASIKADAEWYAKNHTEHYRIFKRLRAYCDTEGPIRLEDGTALGLFSDGNEWDHRGIANEFPATVTAKSIRISGPVDLMDRAISLIAEETPAIAMSDDEYELDRDACNGILTSEAAPRLKQHIHPKPGRLQVK
jgi:hypothetical protein